MTTPAPSEPNPTPAPVEGQPAATPGHEHQFLQFWEKNSRTIYVVCAVILIAIIAKGGLDTYARYKNDQVGRDYAACSTSEKLKAFAAAHTGHQLAGAARLRLADEAYAAGNYTQAAADYQAAADALKASPFASRARIGIASAKLYAGQTADAEAAFKLIANDASLLKAARAEAAYQLASTAAAAGRNDEALKYLDQINTIEQSGFWAQRAIMLRMSLPAPAATTPAAPTINLQAKP